MALLWAKKTIRTSIYLGMALSLTACATSGFGKKPVQETSAPTVENIHAGAMVRVTGEQSLVEVKDYYLAASGESCIRYAAVTSGYKIACRATGGDFAVTGTDLTGLKQSPSVPVAPQATVPAITPGTVIYDPAGEDLPGAESAR